VHEEYKELCIIDLSRYVEHRIMARALRLGGRTQHRIKESCQTQRVLRE
jgi:hypothetical protein